MILLIEIVKNSFPMIVVIVQQSVGSRKALHGSDGVKTNIYTDLTIVKLETNQNKQTET